jgi:hypothetical protein
MFVGFKWTGSWLARDIDVFVVEVIIRGEIVPPIGMDSADTDKPPKREICMDNPHFLPITQPGSSTITSL